MAATGRGRKWRQQPQLGDLADPRGLAALIAAYLDWMEVRNYSRYTVYSRSKGLRNFQVWCDYRGLTRPAEVTKPIVERYQRWLFHYRKADGQPLSFHSQYLRLVDVKSFFKWLSKHNLILSNPAADVDLPRQAFRLPAVVLTEEEVDRVMAQVDLDDPLGIRDRAIIETLYSTGVRRLELLHLRLYDVDRGRGAVRIDQGKGRKDRIVPIGERALAWIDRYLELARPRLTIDPAETTLFLSNRGGPIEGGWVGALVRGYVERAKLGKSGSCHMFRHTMATMMLENGADLRFIQLILGHATIKATEVYTQVGIRKLKEIHSATHPGARLDGASSTLPAETNAAAQARAEILSALEAEATEEHDGGEPSADR